MGLLLNVLHVCDQTGEYFVEMAVLGCGMDL